MEVPPQVEKYLLDNFNTLPKDVIVYLTQFLKPEDVLKLCGSDTRFRDICKKYDLYDRSYYDYVKENAPFAIPLVSIKSQALAIKNGQVTTYRYDPNTRHVSIGLGISPEEDDIFFEIKGSPAKSGTKLWLLAEYANNQDHITPGLVYLSIEDLKSDLNNPDRRYEVLDGILGRYVDPYLSYDRKSIIDEVVQDLIDGAHDDYFIHHITID